MKCRQSGAQLRHTVGFQRGSPSASSLIVVPSLRSRSRFVRTLDSFFLSEYFFFFLNLSNFIVSRCEF